MASTKLTDRTEPSVIPRAHAPVRSRLPSVLRIPILVGLNLRINLALWSTVTNFLNPELGQISKVPREDDDFSLYSPGARILMRILTTWMTWYFNYDFLDVTALTVLTQAPFVYLLSTYYEISALTIVAYVHIEVLSYAIPTYLLRPRSVVHKQNAPLRNRFLLNSVQVQTSGALLAIGVYVTVLYAGLKTGWITDYLITYFDIPTVETAHLESPLTIGWKVWTAGVAARAFLLNPSIAAQPQSGAETPVEEFNPATADLTQTFKANTWFFSKRTRTLIQQTVILNAFLFANNVQKCMTLTGTEMSGAAGYASVWVFANSIIALWYAWVGDTSPNYEPL